MKSSYIKTINGCEVTIGFVTSPTDAKGQALWIILEGFKQRVRTQHTSAVEGDELNGEYCV